MNACIGVLPLLRTSALLAIFALPVAGAAQTQDEMNSAACAEQQKAEERLESVYAEVLGKYSADRVFIKSLKQSQKAWLAYRDAQIRTLYPRRDPGEYGSVYPMCRCNSVTEMTEARTSELRQWTEGSEEGDVCAGSRALKRHGGAKANRGRPAQ